MRIFVRDTHRSSGELAARKLGAALRRRPNPTLGVATGGSPLGIYGAFASGVGIDGIDLSEIRAFALDEYVDLAADHPERYANVIDREITTRIGLSPMNVLVPDGMAADLAVAAATYEKAIEDAGGIDAQILGIGRNGHIGFNEPGSSLGSRTRVVALTDATRTANARFFDGIQYVPTRAITQGVGTIMRAQTIVLVAHGEEKAEAVRQVAEGAVSSRWPGSVLQMHPDVTMILDESAASRLDLLDQYQAEARLLG